MLDESSGRIEVVVPDDQLSPGHRAPRPERPARVAADRLDIDILTEAEEIRAAQAEEFAEAAPAVHRYPRHG